MMRYEEPTMRNEEPPTTTATRKDSCNATLIMLEYGAIEMGALYDVGGE